LQILNARLVDEIALRMRARRDDEERGDYGEVSPCSGRKSGGGPSSEMRYPVGHERCGFPVMKSLRGAKPKAFNIVSSSMARMPTRATGRSGLGAQLTNNSRVAVAILRLASW
jgi:hypothetical protein